MSNWSNWSTPLREWVRPPGVTSARRWIVEPGTFKQLLVAAGERYPGGFEPMMSEGLHWTYRAWLRLPDGRTFGRPAATADEAARNLTTKLRAPVR